MALVAPTASAALATPAAIAGRASPLGRAGSVDVAFASLGASIPCAAFAGVAAVALYLLGTNVWTRRLRTLADTQENIAYCTSHDPQQTLDFYRPKNHRDETLPLIVYIHGGGWRSCRCGGRVPVGAVGG